MEALLVAWNLNIVLMNYHFGISREAQPHNPLS